MQEYGISARLTFSNSPLGRNIFGIRNAIISALYLRKVRVFRNGVILYSDLLLEYLRKKLSGILFCFIHHQGSDGF